MYVVLLPNCAVGHASVCFSGLFLTESCVYGVASLWLQGPISFYLDPTSTYIVCAYMYVHR